MNVTITGTIKIDRYVVVFEVRKIIGPKSIMLYGRLEHILRSVSLLTNLSKNLYTHFYRSQSDESGTCHKSLITQKLTE